MTAAIIVFIGVFFFNDFNFPSPPNSHKQPNEQSTSKDKPFHVPKDGLHKLIGTSGKDVKKKFGKPARVDPSPYGYDWWIYNQDRAHYVQIGIENDKVVTVFAMGKKLNTGAFSIGQNSDDILSNIPLDSTVSLKTEKGSYQFELSEQELYARPLVTLDHVWVILYFDQFTHKLEGLRYLNADTLVKLKPYSLDYRGELVEPKQLSRSEWRAVEEGEQRQIFDMTNIIRERFNLEPLKWNEKVAEVAFGHSKDMGVHNFFSHTSPTEGDLGNRFHKAGIMYMQAGENIAAGYTDGIAATFGWLNSKDHRKNLLHKTYADLGVGVYQKQYTQDFLKPF